MEKHRQLSHLGLWTTGIRTKIFSHIFKQVDTEITVDVKTKPGNLGSTFFLEEKGKCYD